MSVRFADSQNTGDSGFPASSISRRSAGNATSALPDDVASSARATSRRVSSSGARPARLLTNSRSGSTLSEPTRHRHIPKSTVRRETSASLTAARPAPP